MGKAKASRGKRQRRTAKQVLAYGPNAKRAHKRKSGRTGKVFSTRLKSLE